MRHSASYVWVIALAQWCRLVEDEGCTIRFDIVDVLVNLVLGGAVLENDYVLCGSRRPVSIVHLLYREREVVYFRTWWWLEICVELE